MSTDPKAGPLPAEAEERLAKALLHNEFLPSEAIEIERKRNRVRPLLKFASTGSDGTDGPWEAVRRGDKWVIRSTSKDIDVAEVIISKPGYSSPFDRADALKLAAGWDALRLLKRLLELEGGAFQHLADEASHVDREYAKKMLEAKAVLDEARGVLAKATGSAR
jgi:hypothetical protein